MGLNRRDGASSIDAAETSTTRAGRDEHPRGLRVPAQRRARFGIGRHATPAIEASARMRVRPGKFFTARIGLVPASRVDVRPVVYRSDPRVAQRRHQRHAADCSCRSGPALAAAAKIASCGSAWSPGEHTARPPVRRPPGTAEVAAREISAFLTDSAERRALIPASWRRSTRLRSSDPATCTSLPPSSRPSSCGSAGRPRRQSHPCGRRSGPGETGHATWTIPGNVDDPHAERSRARTRRIRVASGNGRSFQRPVWSSDRNHRVRVALSCMNCAAVRLLRGAHP